VSWVGVPARSVFGIMVSLLLSGIPLLGEFGIIAGFLAMVVYCAGLYIAGVEHAGGVLHDQGFLLAWVNVHGVMVELCMSAGF